MNEAITTIYCLCDDFLKAMHRFDDPQVRLTTAEVMTLPLGGRHLLRCQHRQDLPVP
jgi:hypothetical protein